MEIANQLIWLNHDPSKQSTFAVVWYLKDHPSLMETPYTFKIMEHNILFNLFTKPQEHQYQIPTYQNNVLLNRKKWQIADPVPSAPMARITANTDNNRNDLTILTLTVG